MAFHKCLRTLITRNRLNKLSRSFLTLSLSSPTPFPSSPHLLSPPLRSRFFSPVSKWIIPFHGPLFLSSPPWMLSQSATPLYIQSDVVLLPKVQALNLLQRRSFPINLALLDRNIVKELCNTEIGGGGADDFVENFLNLPNLISISRLVSGPFLGWMIVNEMYLPAFIGLGISGTTDWLDGFVARKMGINSAIGSYLDPLADKVLIGSVAVAMVYKGLLHPGLVGLVVLRDVALIGGAMYKRASSLNWDWKDWYEFFNIDGAHTEKVEPLFLSKVNTVFQLVLVAAALLQPEFGTPETESYITYLSWLVASTTVTTTAAYGVQYMRSRPMVMTRKQ